MHARYFIALLHAANCNPPDGAYIIPNTSTLAMEGAEVTYINFVMATTVYYYKEKPICINKGEWEPNSSIICVQYSSITACPITLHAMVSVIQEVHLVKMEGLLWLPQ